MEAFVSSESFGESGWMAALVIVALFSGDILLPVPSSAVCAVAGKLFGIVTGTLLCWVGLNLSALIGYLLGWYLGWPAVSRWSNEEDARDVEAWLDRWGAWPIVLFRPVPVLAEASILLLGTYRYAAKKFWPPIIIANLVFAASFVVLGNLFAEQGNFLMGVAVSCIVPVLMLLVWTSIGKPGTV